MRYLVTGGAGFIGSHLVDRLIVDGHAVVVIDDCSGGGESRLSAYIEAGRVVLFRRSILDDITDIFTQYSFDGIFHLVAQPQVQYSILHPRETHEVNVTGTLALLEMARMHGVQRFIFASSAAVYGDDAVVPCGETARLNPLSPYALHKQIGEEYLALYYRLYGLETVSLRFFNVYGPRQNPDGAYASLIPKTLARINAKESPRINGDGEQTRDFVFVTDVVAALIGAMTTDNAKAFGMAFNVGSGHATSVNTIVTTLLQLAESSLTLAYGESVVEPRNSCADISRIQAVLDWSPRVSVTEGLTAVITSLSD